MKKWTKLTALMLTAAMVMTGCGGSDTSADGAAEGAYNIGIIQQMEHGSLDAATQGFQDKLTELLGEGNVTFDYQNAQGEQTNCTTIATKFVSDGVDLIMANATSALQAAYAATADIPIVGTSVTDYVTAGVVDSNEAPGRNVTGASDLAPIDEQIAMLMELVPDVPEGFDEWIHDCAMREHRYLVYDGNSKIRIREAFCTECGSHMKSTQRMSGFG